MTDATSCNDGPPAPPMVLLLSVVDRKALEAYAVSLASVRCYAQRHRYAHRQLIHPEDELVARCPGPVWLFKHCAAHLILAAGGIDVLVQLDGDTTVVSPQLPLTRYMPLGPVHVVHYERFHTGEVMSGNYIARASPPALTYLRSYYERGLRCTQQGVNCSGFPNTDNGVLHVHLAMAAAGPTAARSCELAFAAASSLATYDRFVARCKPHIYRGANETPGARLLANGFVLVLDRANGWAVDGWALDFKVTRAGSPLMHHGTKPWLASDDVGCCRPFHVARSHPESCTLPLSAASIASDADMRAAVLAADVHFAAARRLSVGLSRIRTCAHRCFQATRIGTCATALHSDQRRARRQWLDPDLTRERGDQREH